MGQRTSSKRCLILPILRASCRSDPLLDELYLSWLPRSKQSGCRSQGVRRHPEGVETISAWRAAWGVEVVVRFDRCGGMTQDMSCCNHRQASSVRVHAPVDLRNGFILSLRCCYGALVPAFTTEHCGLLLLPSPGTGARNKYALRPLTLTTLYPHKGHRM